MGEMIKRKIERKEMRCERNYVRDVQSKYEDRKSCDG